MRAAALLAALALICAAAGCGGDGYPDKPQEVAKAYVATNAGSKCRFLTQRLIESLTHRQGPAARAACERNVAKFDAPAKVSVREAEVEDRRSEVEVVMDGREAKLSLAKQDDRWLIEGFAE
jgi:hypothetical protein